MNNPKAATSENIDQASNEEILDLADLEDLDFVLEELEDKIAPIALA